MKFEYATTVGDWRPPADDPSPPPGEGWDLVNTCALSPFNDEYDGWRYPLVWTWKRSAVEKEE